MALTYSGHLRMALQTAHYIKVGEWPESWGEFTYKNVSRRIRHRRKKAQTLQPLDIRPYGNQYVQALYDYSLLTAKNHFRSDKMGPGWRKLQGILLQRALDLKVEVEHYLTENPELETTDDA